MSLVCHECGSDVQPSKELPGRDGVLLYPVLLALAYVPLKDKNITFKACHKEVPANKALCYSCIENAISKEKHEFSKNELMKDVYACHKAKNGIEKIRADYRGRFLDDRGSKEHDGFWEEHDKHADNLIKYDKRCIITGKDLIAENFYFAGHPLDGTNSHTTSFGSYSFMVLHKHGAYFEICKDIVSKHFPRIFEGLSHELLGEEDTTKFKGCEIYVDESVKQELEKQGKSLQDILKDSHFDIK